MKLWSPVGMIWLAASICFPSHMSGQSTSHFAKPSKDGSWVARQIQMMTSIWPSRVIPMGWSAAVTVVQHLHRRMALSPRGLEPSRELQRERPLPEKELGVDNAYWNLYIGDFTLLETLVEGQKEEASSQSSSCSESQRSIRNIYEGLNVPYSKDKGEVRVKSSDKLGAHINGEGGTLGIGQLRAVELLSLGLHLVGSQKVPTKWMQIFMGKFVHVMQFRRPLFCLVERLWTRITKFSVGPLRRLEVEELLLLVSLLPLCYSDLNAAISGQVTASDASESGGGLTRSTGLSGPGLLGLTERNPLSKGGTPRDWNIIARHELDKSSSF